MIRQHHNLQTVLHTKRLVLMAMAVATALLGLYLLSPSNASAPLSKGAVTDITWGISQADVDRTIIALKDAKITWVRANISWIAIENNGRSQYDQGNLADYDLTIQKLRSAGINVLMPVADGSPCWASADPTKDCVSGTWNKNYRPADYQDYARFYSFVVNRYKTMGVHTYEVWNEPNHPTYWPGGISAAEYVKMLKAAYPAIKAADPTSTVLLGGLSGNDYEYLQQIYDAGGGAYFDVVNVHPYTGLVDPTLCWDQTGSVHKAKDAFCGIESVYATMSANGHGGRELWLTEFGYSTCASCEYGVSETQQAEFIKKALQKAETYPYVTKLFVYNFRNTYWLDEDQSQWEANAGLLHLDFSPKPAYAVFKEYAGASDTTPPSLIGDTNGDGKVNIVDLSRLLSAWNTTEAAMDLNHNGKVDIADLSVLLTNWRP